MCSKHAVVDNKPEKLEAVGPFALKMIAFIAGAAVFLPLLAAFAAPFIG